MDKAIFLGFSILEHSKITMYSYLYDHLYKVYKPENVKMIYGDTDSKILEIKTDDLYQDMIDNREHYDFSGYTKNHPMYHLIK